MLRTMRLFTAAFFETARARRAHGPLRPTWTFSFEWVIRYLRRDWEDTSAWPLPRLRADMDRRPYPQAMARKTRTRDGELGGVPVRWFEPPGAAEGRVVLFFHGGSFVYGSARTTHADLIARLALASGVAVLAVEYRLAPEHPFPAQREDALAVWDALVAGGTRPEHVALAGDSAGGNLALELQLALRDRGGPQAAAAVLMSPWADLRMSGDSYADNDPYDFGTRAELVVHARAFAGETPLDDPRISPVCARLDGLAPVLVSVGEVEIPRDDVLALAARLEAAGVDVTLHEAKDMPHNPAVFAAYHPSGQAALEAAALFAKRALA